MIRQLLSETRPALVGLVVLSVLTGIVYPAFTAAIADTAMSHKARGSLIEEGGTIVGSELVAQKFTSPRFFRPRPSAVDYNAAASSGSNLGPTNPALEEAVKTRIDSYRAGDPDNKAAIPVDLVTTSGSGLDPDISVQSALWQAPRVARERGLPVDVVHAAIEARKQSTWGDGPRVNVLLLNQDLEKLKTKEAVDGRKPTGS